MLVEYTKITDAIIEALKVDDNEKVSKLLDNRDALIQSISNSGDIIAFKEEYKNSSAYKKDLDIEFMLSESKKGLLKEIHNFNKLKDGNMAYINTSRDTMKLFIAKV